MNNDEGRIPHPAKYSDEVMREFARAVRKYLPRNAAILDPFAGTGKIMELEKMNDGLTIYGIEIELEWAGMTPHVIWGDALQASRLFDKMTFDAIMTSPCYGNRMADHHNAKDASVRNTYRHKLGRELTPGSAGGLQWGTAYRELHVRAWVEVGKLLASGGYFILNISNHIRKGQEIPVAQWHQYVLGKLGYALLEDRHVPTPRLRYGENDRARVDYEHVYVFEAQKLLKELSDSQFAYLVNGGWIGALDT